VKVFRVGMEKGVKKVETIVIEIEAKDAEEAGVKSHEMLWKFRDGEEMHYYDKSIEESIDYACVTSITEKKDILSEEDPSGLVADYCFIGGLNEESFIEIYYLLSPYGEDKIFITETNVENY